MSPIALASTVSAVCSACDDSALRQALRLRLRLHCSPVLPRVSMMGLSRRVGSLRAGVTQQQGSAWRQPSARGAGGLLDPKKSMSTRSETSKVPEPLGCRIARQEPHSTGTVEALRALVGLVECWAEAWTAGRSPGGKPDHGHTLPGDRSSVRQVVGGPTVKAVHLMST